MNIDAIEFAIDNMLHHYNVTNMEYVSAKEQLSAIVERCATLEQHILDGSDRARKSADKAYSDGYERGRMDGYNLCVSTCDNNAYIDIDAVCTYEQAIAAQKTEQERKQ